MDSDSKPIVRDLALVFLASALFFCIGLAARPYLTPSEARYIELPRQMLATGDWLTPRINGVPYFEKPPLFYWLQAAIMSLGGIGEFSGRLGSVLVLSATCMLTYALGRKFYGRIAGLFSALVLATSLLGYGLSRIAGLDAMVSLFITACIGCFILAQNSAHKRRFYLAMYAASALAVLTKGLIGMVIPGLVIGAWIALTRNWRLLKEAQLPLGLVLFLAIAAPWHLLMARIHPEFLNFYFIHEHFTRYMTDEHKRTAPWWFFILVVAAGSLPWSGLLPQALKDRGEDKQRSLFILLWVTLPFLFFSISHSKLVPYIFPVFPPLAILLGNTLARSWRGEISSKSLRISALISALFFIVCIAAYHLLPLLPGKAGRTLANVGDIPIGIFFPILLAAIALLYAAFRAFSVRRLIFVLAAFATVVDVSSNVIAARFDSSSVKPLTELIAPLPDDMVVAYHSYWQDLPVYLNRNVTVVGYAGELSFGVEHYPQTHAWMIEDGEFEKRCASATHNVYVFMDQQTFAQLKPIPNCPLEKLAGFGKTVLLQKTGSAPSTHE